MSVGTVCARCDCCSRIVYLRPLARLCLTGHSSRCPVPYSFLFLFFFFILHRQWRLLMFFSFDASSRGFPGVPYCLFSELLISGLLGFGGKAPQNKKNRYHKLSEPLQEAQEELRARDVAKHFWNMFGKLLRCNKKE